MYAQRDLWEDIHTSVLQCVAVWCSVLQCVAVCCRPLRRYPYIRLSHYFRLSIPMYVHSVMFACMYVSWKWNSLSWKYENHEVMKICFYANIHDNVCIRKYVRFYIRMYVHSFMKMFAWKHIFICSWKYIFIFSRKYIFIFSWNIRLFVHTQVSLRIHRSLCAYIGLFLYNSPTSASIHFVVTASRSLL